ncbi:hypothetical protein B0T16DRAFT_385518 [Cercophora newfieldiana]|uniref:BZIP domain-containing protein n=1 Tax=Cercophora newfieldiana TaxID=92897 RepID=A0AA40CZ80_9PEZI|nr:hypothetical protein B0T16DRAFT_385518 [Cercophora newfieldiana]
MNRGDQDHPDFLPNVTDDFARPEHGLDILAPDDSSFYAHHYYDGDAFDQQILMAPGAHQYPLTPLEGSQYVLPGAQPPFQASTVMFPYAFPPAEPEGTLESGSQRLAQNFWAGPLPQQAISPADGQISDVAHGFMLPNQPQELLDHGYFPPTNAEPPSPGTPIANDGSSPAWGAFVPGPSFLATPVNQHEAAAGSESPASTNAEKAKRKRGRPRVYEDDGIERPRRRPGRPPIYVVGSESASPSSPHYQSFQSASSTPGSNLAISPGWSATLSSDPSTSSSTPSANKGKTKSTKRPAGIDNDENGDEDDEEEREKQTIVRARNKTAASRYRAKTQTAIAMLEAKEENVSTRRQELMDCAAQLHEEIFYLKNEVLRQASCGCPLIAGYLTEAANLAYPGGPWRSGRTGSISSGMEGMSLAARGGRGQFATQQKIWLDFFDSEIFLGIEHKPWAYMENALQHRRYWLTTWKKRFMELREDAVCSEDLGVPRYQMFELVVKGKMENIHGDLELYRL